MEHESVKFICMTAGYLGSLWALVFVAWVEKKYPKKKKDEA